MKKKYIASLSIILTTYLLTLTACGNNNDTSVSAMNDIPAETETTTVNESTTVDETTTVEETTTTVEETTIQDTSIADDEITDEDNTTETTESTGKVRKAPFTVDDFDISDEDKEEAQELIDYYESGDIMYLDLLDLMSKFYGVDTSQLKDEYIKSQGGSTSSSSSSTTGTTQATYPENYNPADYGLYDETPEQTIGTDELHPEYSNVHVQ